MAGNTFSSLVAETGKVFSKEERLKNLDGALKGIEKQFGKGTIKTLKNEFQQYAHYPTGIMSVDLAIGIGGLPRGRIVEFYGQESSGKSTLALVAAGMIQKSGGIAALVDAEHAYDKNWGAKLGIDNEEFLVAQPNNGEEALSIVESLVKANAVDLIIVDSVSALVPRAELEGDMGDAQMGLQARLMGQAMRKLTGIVSESQCTVIFINQLREKLIAYGDPRTTSGGNALKFYASVRGEVSKGDKIKQGDKIIGIKSKIKFQKNKMAPPFTEATYTIFYETGPDFEGSIIEEAVKWGVIRKAGAWTYYGEEKFNGVDKLVEYLKTKSSELPVLREKVMAAFIEKISKGEKAIEVDKEDDSVSSVPAKRERKSSKTQQVEEPIEEEQEESEVEETEDEA